MKEKEMGDRERENISCALSHIMHNIYLSYTILFTALTVHISRIIGGCVRTALLKKILLNGQHGSGIILPIYNWFVFFPSEAKRVQTCITT